MQKMDVAMIQGIRPAALLKECSRVPADCCFKIKLQAGHHGPNPHTQWLLVGENESIQL
jgi:hypothetical protein